MRRKLALGSVLLGLAAAWPTVAGASSDIGCATTWTLTAPSFSCGNRIVIGPGNDTRVNLLLLVRDRGGLDGQGLGYTAPEWFAADLGHTFFYWDSLVQELYPPPAGEEGDEPVGDFYGTRCQSVEAGGADFIAAVGRNRRIGAGDRDKLAAGRAVLLELCRNGGTQSEGAQALPDSYASAEAREFGGYLAGAAAFYGGEWDTAQARFAALKGAGDPWVREAALYMAARSELAAANAVALDEWGFFDPAKADKAGAARAERALAAYLAAYPRGTYAESAQGLVRRALWLQGALDRQGREYARLLAAADPGDPWTSGLIDEIDNKFLFLDGAGTALDGPWLLAVHDLMRLRGTVAPEDGGDTASERYGLPLLSAGELAAQEPAFAGNPQLYAFLKANRAFYVDKDYRAVLQLLPDDARQPAYSPLAFSRQVLRGMALAALGDRNEAGFWQELLGGAKGLYQRPTVELGLALNWERSGQVGKVFAAGSPIADDRIRAILLTSSAGPEVLRAAAKGGALTPRERELAAFVLLARELSRGAYAAAGEDLALVPDDASTEGGVYGDLSGADLLPLGLFARGTFAEDYACPALRQTIAALARNPGEVKGRLCLAEFYRLNGFDDLTLDGAREKGELGSFAAYPGTPVTRGKFYADVIAEPGVAHEDRAYALYRMVNCYAPAGYSSCGREQAPESERRAWFRRLKGEFADTRWGRELKYYW